VGAADRREVTLAAESSPPRPSLGTAGSWRHRRRWLSGILRRPFDSAANHLKREQASTKVFSPLTAFLKFPLLSRIFYLGRFARCEAGDGLSLWFDVDLTPREKAVLAALREGLSEKQIARRLGISLNTVHVYVKSIYRSYGVNSLGELLSIWASENAWGQRSAGMASSQGNHPSVAEELARTAEHLRRALHAAQREERGSAERGAIAAALMHVESLEATLKKLGNLRDKDQLA